MNTTAKIKRVAFLDLTMKKSFEKLKSGKFEDKQFAGFIDRAMDDLKENPYCGIKILKKQWPEEYVKKYKIKNLWKYDLPNAWRLTYTIEQDNVEIVSIILEWFDHKDYEKRFGY